MKAERFFEGAATTLNEWPLDHLPVIHDDLVTRQTIFDRVVFHYRHQRTRCPREGRCFYRFADAMCFVGPFIDDAHYDLEMEGYRVRELVKAFAMPRWFRDNIDFLEELQSIHDTEANWDAPDRMEMVLELFAAERGLTISLG
jgi:hypothetical protein